MTDCDWVQRLFSYAADPKVKRDLSTMRCIDAWQGHLHRRFASIHIAGTNGKGSVALKIASALQERAVAWVSIRRRIYQLIANAFR